MLGAIYTTVLLAAILILLIYFYFTWTFDHWTKRGISGPKPSFGFGSFPNAIKQARNVIYDIDEIYKKYKGVERFVGTFWFRSPTILILDRELIRDVYVRKFKNFHDNNSGAFDVDKNVDKLLSLNPFFLSGDEWKEKRAEVVPALTSSRIRAMYPIMQAVCKKMSNYLKAKLKSEPDLSIDAKDVATRFTAENVGNSIYGIDAGAFNVTNDKCTLRDVGKSVLEVTTGAMLYFFIVTFCPLVKKVYVRPFMPAKTEQFFIKLMNDAIEVREKHAINRADFLQYFLELRDRKNLSTTEMAAHTLTFFVDGYETSSGVIAHVLYMLAKHPEIQHRLRDEINTETSEGISFEKLNDFTYLEQIMNETLRLHSPLLFNMKLCTESCDFETSKDKIVRIEKGDSILISVYSVHHDAEYYPEPEKFDPERFSVENGGFKKYKDMGVFLPFGDGPRTCLGMKFGIIQTKAAIVEIVRNFEVTVNEKTQNDYEFDPVQFLSMPKGGIWLNLKEI